MAQHLKIVTHPDNRLRLVSTLLASDVIARADIQQLCDDLVATMYADDGIGLAAPQIGHNIRIIVIGKDAFGSNAQDLVIINPEINDYSLKKTVDEEGCLSVPGLVGDVERHERVTLTGMLRDGTTFNGVLSGYASRVAQHESDHLNGVLFIDRATHIRPTRYRAAL